MTWWPEPSAAPFHDWNERITHECYAAVRGGARPRRRRPHQRSVNLYEWVSFDVGADAAALARGQHAPNVYDVILAADEASARRLRGHGNAIAMPFNHVILPLASRRDKVTEIRWGLADFRRRFGRDAEGFWLPETAVDEETLVVLAEEGIRFTILASHQLENPAVSGEPFGFAAGGGREIAIFAYDGALAADVAFGRLLENGSELARAACASRRRPWRGPEGHARRRARARRRDVRPSPQVRRDGAGDGASRCSAPRATAYFENYASVLARGGPARARVAGRTVIVELRARRRAVALRLHVRHRAGHLARVAPSAARGAQLAGARDRRAVRVGGVRAIRRSVGRARRARRAWRARRSRSARRSPRATSRLPPSNAVRALQLLDAQRARLAMFGSCAWFFDDIAGHEAVLMLGPGRARHRPASATRSSRASSCARLARRAGQRSRRFRMARPRIAPAWSHCASRPFA